LPVDPLSPVTVLTDPLLTDPLLTDPLLTDPLLTDPLLTDPLLVDPMLPVSVLVDPMAGPSDDELVGLVLALPVTGELDVGVAGVEEPLPGVDEDAGAWGLAALDGLAVPVVQEGAGLALADALPLPLVLAFAEAAGVAVLMVVALAVPLAGVVVVSPGLLLPPAGPSLVPLSVALSDGLLTELAGVSLGVAEVVGLACLAGADGAEPDAQAIAGTLPWAAEVPPPAPPAAEPAGVPSPFVL
jgi:hypothetical protein